MPDISVTETGPSVSVGDATTPAVTVSALGAAGAAGPAGAPGVVQSVNGHATTDVVLTAADVSAVPAAGGMMTGPLTLNADPTANLGAATKQYVDTHGGGAVASVNGHTGVVVLGASDVSALAAAGNLSDVASVAASRTSLGLGNSATRAIGTTAGTVAAGDDSRITGAIQPANAAATVAAQTAYGQPSAVGIDTTYAREDHAHGTPALPAALPPNGAASGDLGGTYPGPAVTATHLASALPIAQGGTGSTTQSFVDLTAAQSVGGVKTFTAAPVVPAASFPETAVAGLTADLAAKTPVSAVRVITAPTVTASAWDVLECDATANPIAVTMPTPTAGTRVTVKKTDTGANAVTVVATVDGGANPALSFVFQTMELVADGTNWARMARPDLAHLADYPATTDTRYMALGAAAGNDLAGNYPNPIVNKVQGVSIGGIPSVGYVPTATGSNAATWQAPPASLPPNGTAGGDLTGTYPSPTLSGTANVEGVIRANRLDQMAAPTAPVAMNTQKITGIGNGTLATDAAALGQIPASLPPNGAAGGDLAGTYPNPTVSATANFKTQVEAVRLDQMAAPTAAVSLNSQKITSLANGSLASDAAAFGQIPTLGSAGSSAVADAASAGTAATASHSDHVHGREAFAAPAAATGYGLSAVTGTAATLAHSDHTHGTPALTVTAPAATEAIGTAAALGSATLPALADHVHPMAGAASPTTSAVGDAAATGAATTFAASNHVHGREAFGSAPATTEGIGAAAAAGTASTPSRSDHVHPMAASATAGASAPGDAASAGANATFAASDHRHSREAYAAAATIAAPGTRAAGSSGTVADGGHVHPSVQYSPADYGWISWTGDPEYTVGATVPTQGGTVYHSRVHCPVAFTATNVILLVTSAGGTLTSGQCFAGLYHAGAGGSLIAATADLSSGANSFATSGSFQFPLVGGPYSLAAGDYTVAFFFNGTTGPTLARFSTTYTALGVPNLSLANGTFRHFTDSTNTVRTTSLPGTIGTQSANNNSWFAAIS